MSETKTTRKQLPAYLILALIALAAALLLAVTNAITAGPIKAHEEAAQNAAFQSVMEADSFSTMSIPDGCNVTSLVEAKKDGKTIEDKTIRLETEWVDASNVEEFAAKMGF